MQNNQATSSISQKARQVSSYLLEYLKNPIQMIRKTPDWDWPTAIAVQATLSALSGALAGTVAGRLRDVITGIIFLPISSNAIALVLAGFFYYTFMFWLNVQTNYRRLFVIIVLAGIPYMALHILSPKISPASLVGLAASGLLLIVGLVENFQVPKKPVMRLIIALFAFSLILWVARMINFTRDTSTLKRQTTPESLDILERELKGN